MHEISVPGPNSMVRIFFPNSKLECVSEIFDSIGLKILKKSYVVKL